MPKQGLRDWLVSQAAGERSWSQGAVGALDLPRGVAWVSPTAESSNAQIWGGEPAWLLARFCKAGVVLRRLSTPALRLPQIAHLGRHLPPGLRTATVEILGSVSRTLPSAPPCPEPPCAPVCGPAALLTF